MITYSLGSHFEKVAANVVGPQPKTTQRNRYIMVIAYYFTKGPEAFLVQTYDADTVTSILVENIVPRHGLPLEIHSDPGRTFELHLFETTCITLGITNKRTTPLHPHPNDMAERLNHSLKQYRWLFIDEHQDNWDTLIWFVLLAYWSAVHSAKNYTPLMLLMSRELRLPAGITFGTPMLSSHVSTLKGLYSYYSRHLRSRRVCVWLHTKKPAP